MDVLDGILTLGILTSSHQSEISSTVSAHVSQSRVHRGLLVCKIALIQSATQHFEVPWSMTKQQAVKRVLHRSGFNIHTNYSTTSK